MAGLLDDCAALREAEQVESLHQPVAGDLDLVLFRGRQRSAVESAASSIVRRARDVGAIDGSRYTSLNVLISKKGWRKEEPVVVERDEPSVLAEPIRVHPRDHQYTISELAGAVGLNTDEFQTTYPVPSANAHCLRLV